MQNAFIVHNLDEAIDRWANKRSVGPYFEFPPLKFAAGTRYGKPQIPTFRAWHDFGVEAGIEAGGLEVFDEIGDLADG